MQTNKTFKIISVTLVVLTILPTVLLSRPKRAEAQFAVFDVGNTFFHLTTSTEQTISTVTEVKSWYKTLMEEVLKAVARKALTEMTKSTVNWINSGFHGSPLFVENPQSFFKDIQKSEIKDLVDIYGYNQLKNPFGKDWALNTINAYKSQLNANSDYTLSKVINDGTYLHNFQNDFNVGGWNGFLINTQFPQNNYVGFQMQANEELARRIAGTDKTIVQKVQDTLQQSGGFLSPQTCTTNPNYNNGYNEWSKPSFDEAQYLKDHPYDPSSALNSPECQKDSQGTACQDKMLTYNTLWDQQHNDAKRLWGKDNSCNKPDGTSGLVSTTPGSVVSSQIMKAMGVSQDQASLGAQLGGSLSAIFDALLNQFVNKGLNSLSSGKNSTPPADTWTYNGLSLGSSGGTNSVGTSGNNTTWDNTPDQVVTLSDFKKQVDDAIKNTQAEIKYLSNNVPDSYGPGVLQLIDQLRNKIKTLDICEPGPDYNWQSRLSLALSAAEGGGLASGGTSNSNLDNTAGTFKNWLTVQMQNALPSSSDYMSTIGSLQNLGTQYTEANSSLTSLQGVLAQLKSIQADLAPMGTQPSVGSADESTMMSDYQQFQSMVGQFSTDASLASAKNELTQAKAKSINLDTLINTCNSERSAKGWDAPGGPDAKLNGGTTEQQYFCEDPLSKAGVSLDCGAIFNASPSDYQGSLP